jgi:exosortase
MNSTNAMNPMTPSKPLALALVCLSFLALYHHVIYKMVLDWSIDANYSHGFLIPFISGYLIWQNRKRLAQVEMAPASSGLILLIVSLLFFVATYLGAELFTMRLSMLLVMLSAIILLAGWPLAKALFLPIIYLLFMIPLPAIIWNKIAFPLKLFATKMAVSVIQALNIPVYGEGNIIHLANTTLEVVDACSGLRSLTSLLALSAAFALITKHSKGEKLVLFLSAIPIAIIVNIFRLSATAVMARYYGARVAQGFLHELSGIIIFSLALILTYSVHLILNKIDAMAKD